MTCAGRLGLFEWHALMIKCSTLCLWSPQDPRPRGAVEPGLRASPPPAICPLRSGLCLLALGAIPGCAHGHQAIGTGERQGERQGLLSNSGPPLR